MNVKFKMPQFGRNLTGKGWLKELLMTVVGTSISIVLALMAGCTKPDRNDEAVALSNEIVSDGLSDVEHSVERVDSAEQVGLFTAVRANTTKAIIYENVDRQQLAAYYSEKAIAAVEGKAVITSADSSLYCTPRWILADCLYANGEYGKSISLAKEILAFLGDGTSPKDVTMKCRALSQIAECESEMNHVDESERLFLQCVEMLMESTLHSTDYGDIDPLIYTLLSLNDLYIDNKMPEKALPLMAKMDTAINRLARSCLSKRPRSSGSNDTDLVLQKRRNHVTISKAMVYAANGQRKQAEALFQQHRQLHGLNPADMTAEGIYLTIMGRYDEALSLFDEADSMMHASGEPITDIYVKTFLVHKYNALQKAGHDKKALALSDYMRQLTDSLRQQEHQTDVEQLQEIKRQENEITSKHQSLVVHRIILASAATVILLIVYLLWRSYKYNKVLTEKNRKLYEEIEQRRKEQQYEMEQLQAAPEEKLTAEQQLYRRLCTLMDEQKPYTDAELNRNMLAQLLGTNAKYVELAIRQCSKGDTVSDFINRYRLEHVTRLLKTTNDPIAIIGELSGIPSRVTLARLFRNAYGMTPTEYRKI